MVCTGGVSFPNQTLQTIFLHPSKRLHGDFLWMEEIIPHLGDAKWCQISSIHREILHPFRVFLCACVHGKLPGSPDWKQSSSHANFSKALLKVDAHRGCRARFIVKMYWVVSGYIALLPTPLFVARTQNISFYASTASQCGQSCIYFCFVIPRRWKAQFVSLQ